MYKQDGRVVETPVEARAGFTGKPVLWVLAISLTLAIVLMVGAWLGHLAF
jgi:hypothetical protein